MYKKNFFFIVFEGIEGSGKSYQSKKLFRNLINKAISTVLTREPGGTKSAEEIRKIILKDYFHKDTKIQFDKYTDTLLYLAARNEHIKNTINTAYLKKKVLICDRFVDSTYAYQVYGKGVKRSFIESIHKHILKKIKPDLTFVLKVRIQKALKRLRKRAKKNRYDKFSKSFYIKAQNAFIKIAKKNRNKYYIFDNSNDSGDLEDKILEIVLKKIKYKNDKKK
tara:strand:- start:919 stop:1584 length:666 start_codon:yes stop_codon:yes gene_type:complete